MHPCCRAGAAIYYPELSQKIMRIFATLFRLAIFLLLLSFAVKNSEMVTIQYYLGIEWELPMIIILFICFTAGTIFGYFSCLLQKLYKKQ